jgi:type IX secretion system PorP/SprF family membrane protein
MRKVITIIVLFFCYQDQCLGQDLVFSQYYASPLTSNPAMTGLFNGQTRISTNYRSQWNNIQTNTYLYQTPSASVDVRIPEKNLSIGIVFVNDQTNNKIFNTLEGGISFGYKLKFNLFEISLGIQGWYKQVYFDQSKVRSSILATEPNLLEQYINLSLNSGLVLTYMFPDEKSSIFYGGSVQNLLEPRDQFVNNIAGNYNLPMRFIFHTGGSFSIKDEYRIIPGLLATYQAKSTQINLGTSVGFHFQWDEKNQPTSTLFCGAWVRFNETKAQAFIPKVGLEYNNFRLGISYDYIINGLASGNTGRPNTLEFSLGYIFKSEKSEDYQCFYSPYF